MAEAITSKSFKQPRDWRRAWQALRNLIDDSERTDEVFAIIDALAGGSYERHFALFCADSRGQRILRERPDLLGVLRDRDRLRAMPDNSLGNHYARFMDSANLDAEGLQAAEEEAAKKVDETKEYGVDRELFVRRIRDMHDLWHVLTGYGRDEAGEAANLAFTLGQIPDLGVGVIVFASALIGPKTPPFHWQRYLFNAWKRGRQASLLCAAPYEDLLERPLVEVRTQLAIAPPEISHPEGIVSANQLESIAFGTA